MNGPNQLKEVQTKLYTFTFFCFLCFEDAIKQNICAKSYLLYFY